MKEVKSLLYLDLMTVTGKTIGENIAGSKVIDREVIRTKARAYSQTAV